MDGELRGSNRATMKFSRVDFVAEDQLTRLKEKAGQLFAEALEALIEA